MRNLKRALSLLLSSTLVLGMLVMGGSAAGYKDVDASNDHQEAIEVLQAVGIMTGDQNGKFNPDGSITRNEMAVIMAHLLNLNYDYYRGTNPFTDVPEWAAPYVAACAAEGVVAGIGNGQFGGNQKVTAAQASLMIMKALGYFQNAEDFGTDWQVATIRQASYINLFDNINSNAESALTRAQVAQLVLNGLKAQMVDFTGDKGIQIGDVTVGYKAEYTARTNANKKYNSIDTGKTDIAGNNQYYVQLGEELYDGDLKLKGSSDDFGRPANNWRYDGKDIGTYTKDADLTYTAKVENGDIYKDLGLSKSVSKNDVTVFVNGIEQSSLSLDIVKGGDDKVANSANGVLTQVYYDSDDHEVLITRVDTYVGTVVKTVDATDKRDAYVVINPETVNPGIGNQEFETEQEFEDDSYVLYTYSESAKEIKSVESAKLVEGVVTRAENTVTNDTDKAALTIDGERYTASANVSGENLSNVSVDEQYTVYLDSYGYLIYVERIDEIGDYALMVQPSAGDLFNAKKAALIFADGTTKVVETAKNYQDAEKLGYDYDRDGDIDSADTTAWATATVNYAPVIVTYRVDEDGVYTLRAVARGTGSVYVAGDEDFTMTNDKAGIEKVGQPIGNNKVVTANSASTFVVRDPSNTAVKTDLGDWTAYTGIKNAPSITATSTTDQQVDVYYYCKSGSMVTVMFIVPEKDVVINDGVNKNIFLAKDSVSNLIHDKDGDYYEYEAVVNGEIKTVKVDERWGKNLNGMYKSYSVDKYGVITNLYGYGVATAEEGLYTGIGIDKVSKEYTVILNTANADMNGDRTPDGVHTITVDEDATFFYVNEDGKISTSSYNGIAIDDNDAVWAVVDDYMVQTLVIYEVPDGGNVTPAPSTDVEVKGISIGSTTYIDWYAEDSSVKTLSEDDIYAILADNGCTDISNDGSTWSFKNAKGLRYNNVTIRDTRVYLVTVDSPAGVTVKDAAYKYSNTKFYASNGLTVTVNLGDNGIYDWTGKTAANVTVSASNPAGASASFSSAVNIGKTLDVDVQFSGLTQDVTVTLDYTA